MTPQELKTSILWNAIQGKLTQQVEGESASELFKDICLSPVFDHEVYFEIPSNWCWCKIKDIFKLVNGKAFKPTDWGNQGLPIVRIQNLNDANAPFNYYNGEIEEKYILHGGELLFSWSGTPGTSFGAFIWNGGKAVLNQHIFIVYPKLEMDYEYARYALNGEIKIFIDKAHGGAGLKHITKKEFENCFLPIPPLAEQKRIVAKIEELLPYIDRYEKAWGRLEDFNKRFPMDMQKSILQMAIQGKLVEQRPEDGTGEELYQQIQAEKQQFIKDGKIKKGKPLPEITEDEIPFEIPESWKWVRLPAISSSCLGKMLDRQKNAGTPMPYLRNVNVRWGSFDLSDLLEMKFEDIEDDRFLIKKNDLVMCEGGEPGRCAVWTAETPIHFQKACHRLRFAQPLDVSFFYHVFCLYANNGLLNNLFTGTTIKHLTGQSLDKIIVPLPPLAEQKRIVAKLEEILPLCERLK